LSLTLSVCPSVCHAPSNCFLFFVSRWNRAISLASFLHVAALYRNLFSDFWFRPPKAQNLFPKICTKSPITRLVWQIDRDVWAYGDGRFNGTVQNVVGPTPVAMATTFGLGAEIQSPTDLSSTLILLRRRSTTADEFWVSVRNSELSKLC